MGGCGVCALSHVLSQGLSEWVQGVGDGVPVGSQSRWGWGAHLELGEATWALSRWSER